MQNGDVYIKGIGNYDGKTLTGATTLQAKIQALESTTSSGLDIDAIDLVASNAVERIQAAPDLEGIKTNLIQFI